MKPLRVAVVFFLFAFGLALRPLVTATHAQSTAVVITIQNFAFSPAVTTVPAGTTIVWSNKDTVDHAPVSDTNVWHAGVVPAGTTSSGTVFNTPGTYPYHCAIHPEMTATIVVTGSGSGPTPTPTVPLAPTATATSVATSATTSTPVPTAGSAATNTPVPTATNTPLPLSVKVAIGHKTVKAGAKQSIKVTTLPGAGISIVVTFPDGTKMHRTATASGSGTFTWTFKQPGRHTTRTKHTAKVAVTVSHGSSSPIKSTKSYTIH